MKTKKRNLLIVSILYAIFAIVTMLIQPAGDDWLIFTKPYWNFGIGPVYRPFEFLFSWVALNYPATFPYFNHAIVLSCHAFNAFFLYKIIRRFNVVYSVAFLASVFFLFAPSVMGAVTSIDGTNQTISTFFSLIGFFFYFKYNGYRKYIGWLFFTMFSAMHKEIGITWFVGIPMLAYIINNHANILKSVKSRYKALLLDIGIGVVFVIIYLLIRVTTSISGMIGANDLSQYPKYTISLGMNLFINMGLLLGNCSSAIDTVAFFGYPQYPVLLAITIFLSFPFLLMTIWQLYKKLFLERQWLLIGSLIVFSIVVISPHLIMGRCGELHAYSLALPYSLLLAILFNGVKKTGLLVFVLISFSISVVIVDFHKWYGTYISGYKGLEIVHAIKSETRDNPKRISIVNIIHKDGHRPYSSFYHGENIYHPYLIKFHFRYHFEKLDHLVLLASDKQLMHKIDSVIVNSKKQNYEYVWIIDKNNAKVIDLENQKKLH